MTFLEEFADYRSRTSQNSLVWTSSSQGSIKSTVRAGSGRGILELVKKDLSHPPGFVTPLSKGARVVVASHLTCCHHGLIGSFSWKSYRL